MPKLQTFYFTAVLPELACPRHASSGTGTASSGMYVQKQTSFVCSGTMVIELREFNDKKKKKKNTMDKMQKLIKFGQKVVV